ncbi:MAG: glycosyltransferase family 4 protein [Candidatus Omnitrophica bacterium]|nr:glycosyltransferase family 4 protein [Candidatus Omnitrophota bacterium]
MASSTRTVGLSLLHLHNWSGTGFYAEQVLEALRTSGSGEFRVVGLSSEGKTCSSDTGLDPEIRNIPAWRLRWPLRALSDWIGSSFGKGIDILHYPSGVGPPTGLRPIVLTLHDVSPFLYPQFFPSPRSIYLRMAITSLVRHASLILVDSLWQKERIEQVFPSSAARIRVLYPTCASVFRESRLPSASIPYPEGDYFLCVGTLEPRKNLGLAIDAWRSHTQVHSLVIVGRWGWMVETLQQQLASLGAYTKQDHYDLWRLPDGREIRRYEFLPTDHLALLYRKALGLIYPSLFEGFGLPVLEAMVSGCPILTSRDSPMEEIAGPAGWYFDPRNSGSLNAALDDFLNNPAERKTRVEAGLGRQKAFSPQTFKEGLLKAYREIP